MVSGIKIFLPIFDSVRFSQGPRGGRSGNFNAPTHPPVLYAEAYTFVFSPRPPPPSPAQKFTVQALFHWIASLCASEYNSDSVLSENQP